MKRTLLSLVALAVLAGCASLSRRIADRDVRERVGILAHLDIAWPDSTRPFQRALAHFRAVGVDKVVVLGDPTRNGYENQRTVFTLAWQKAFAGVTAPQLVMSADPYEYGGIRFTGFGQLPLTDLLCVHPRNGHVVNVGSMHGFKVSDFFEKQPGSVVAQMNASAQGVLVIARDDGLEIRRLDFSLPAAEEVGPPWRVDRAGLIHSEEDDVPKFWDDTLVGVTPGYDAKGNRIYTLRWPPVLAKHTGARAFSYDVSAGGEVIGHVQSTGFYLPESRDAAAVKCTVLAKGLKEDNPKFGITPISSMGKKGPTVWSR